MAEGQLYTSTSDYVLIRLHMCVCVYDPDYCCREHWQWTGEVSRVISSPLPDTHTSVWTLSISEVLVLLLFCLHLFCRKPESPRYKALNSKHKDRPSIIAEAQLLSVPGEQNGHGEVCWSSQTKPLIFQTWKLWEERLRAGAADRRRSEQGGCQNITFMFIATVVSLRHYYLCRIKAFSFYNLQLNLKNS